MLPEPTSALVHRAAQAMYDRALGVGNYALLPEHRKEACRADVAAVFEAMREPTEFMLRQAMPWADEAGALDVWRAMIDACLREPTFTRIEPPTGWPGTESWAEPSK